MHRPWTGLPGVGEDERPEEPEAAFGVEEQGRVAVGEPRRVGEQEGVAPPAGPCLLAGAVDRHVVGGALAAAAVPRHEEVAVGTLDDSWRMVVLGMEREDKLRLVQGAVCPRVRRLVCRLRASLQAREGLSELLLLRLVVGQGLAPQTGQELVPDQVQLPLHVIGVRGNRDDHVLLRQHDAELAVRSVTPVRAVPTSPELESIALLPVAPVVAAVRRLPAGRLTDP